MSPGFYPIRNTGITLPLRIAFLTILLGGVGSAAGQKLEISGQNSLSTVQGEPITLQLSDFSVRGSEAKNYPEGFDLVVFDGRNYTSSGTTVTPDRDFAGALKVEIRIRKFAGAKMIAQTKKTNITIDVLQGEPENVPPQIIGQTPLRTAANRAITVTLANLTVVDPDDDYPNGFTLKLGAGENYTISGTTITPVNGFTGELVVKTRVNDGEADSPPFDVVVEVVPGDDDPGGEPGEYAPAITNFSTTPLLYPLGHRNFPIAPEIGIEDKDSDDLFYAEIFFDAAQYANGKDEFTVGEHPVIQTIFDAKKGLLLLFGRAALPEYQALLKSVRYEFLGDTLPARNSRRVHFRLSDGVHLSEIKTKTIYIVDRVGLDIPTVFTPNDDQANDVWKISPSGEADNLNAVIRVFDVRGRLVFEASDLFDHWDGRFRGDPVPAGVYYYVISLSTGGNTTDYSGVVTILR